MKIPLARLNGRTSLVTQTTLAIALLAGAPLANAQDQFRFGNSSVGRADEGRGGSSSRASADRASASRGASRIDSNAGARTISRPTTFDRAPSFGRTGLGATNSNARSGADRSRNEGGRGNDRGGSGRSAIDPDGDGIGMRNPGSSRDRDNRNNDRGRNDYDRHDDRYGHDRGDNDNFRFRLSLGSTWSSCSYGCGSSCSHVSRSYGTCGVSGYRCGACDACLGYGTRSTRVVYANSSWSDPWATPYVEPIIIQPVYVEPVVVVPQTVVQPVYVQQVPVIVYATTDVSNAILAADAGAHARAISLMRAYAAQHGRLPDIGELGPAARASLHAVWRTYERAALTPGANADTYFMLGATRALRGDRELAIDAFEAALAWGETDPSSDRLRTWLKGP